MAPSLARVGACDASFFRSNARGASGDATRSATGVAASVARVAGERVSTLCRDDDAPREAIVSSDVSAEPVLGSRPEGLRGGVPAAELERPRRGDPWGDGIATRSRRVPPARRGLMTARARFGASGLNGYFLARGARRGFWHFAFRQFCAWRIDGIRLHSHNLFHLVVSVNRYY